MKSPLLEVRSLSTHFFTEEGVVRAVENVSLQINPGEILSLVGESGCGKSVTGLSILKLILSPPGRIVNGEILFDGRNLLQLEEKEMERVRGNEISMIFQEPMTSLNPVFTIGDQIMEAILLHQGLDKTEARGRAIEMLDRVQILSPETRIDAYPHQLSGGMRQRAMIAMALSCQPKLLIADEPTTALDVTIQAQVLNLLMDLRDQLGLTYLFISHDLRIVKHISDQIAVMYMGKIVEMANGEDLFLRPLHPYTQTLLHAIPKLDPSKKRERSLVKEEFPPIPSDQGCRFQPRCPHSKERCQTEEPLLLDEGENHSVACHFVSPKDLSHALHDS